MPTILRILGYRFFFFSNEGSEPLHVHVESGDSVAKFWLDPVRLTDSYGFRGYELSKVTLLVIEHRLMFLEKWNEFFGNKA